MPDSEAWLKQLKSEDFLIDTQLSVAFKTQILMLLPDSRVGFVFLAGSNQAWVDLSDNKSELN